MTRTNLALLKRDLPSFPVYNEDFMSTVSNTALNRMFQVVIFLQQGSVMLEVNRMLSQVQVTFCALSQYIIDPFYPRPMLLRFCRSFLSLVHLSPLINPLPVVHFPICVQECVEQPGGGGLHQWEDQTRPEWQSQTPLLHSGRGQSS